MNRIIKFRAWDKDNEVMIKPEDLCHLDGTLSESLIEAAPYLEIMQFTGLHDRNGKEIYEGDLISNGKVIFEKHNASFIIIGKDWELPMNYAKEFKVKGNIFEGEFK